ncbi:adhesion G-protein coupled receptor F1-like [Aplochiton taeniatus]
MLFLSFDNVLPVRDSRNVNQSDNIINGNIVLVKNNRTISNVSFIFNIFNKNLSHPQCVFWNFSLLDGLGGWDNRGCELGSNVNDMVTCTCNHLTSFSMSPTSLTDPDLDVFLDSIAYLGVGVSMACLITCLIIEAVVWKKVCTNTTSHMRHVSIVNIAVSLLLADIWFIISVSIHDDNIWLNPPQPNNQYSQKDGVCWLNWDESHALLAFVIPVLVIVFINFVILIVVMIKIEASELRRMTGPCLYVGELSVESNVTLNSTTLMMALSGPFMLNTMGGVVTVQQAELIAGTYRCDFTNQSISYMASAEVTVALLPDPIILTIYPWTVDCSTDLPDTSKNVKVTATIEKSSENYKVEWFFDGAVPSLMSYASELAIKSGHARMGSGCLRSLIVSIRN